MLDTNYNNTKSVCTHIRFYERNYSKWDTSRTCVFDYIIEYERTIMKDKCLPYISVNEVLNQLQSRMKDALPYVIKTGINIMDVLIDGFYPGELCVIGARPAMGKSMFVHSLISNMVCKGIPVGLFTATDNLDVNFMCRIVCAVKDTIVPHSYEERIKIIQDTTLEGVPLYLKSDTRMTILSLRENAIKMKEEKGVKCLFIETIQALFDSEENGSTKEGMERICRELKNLAQELDIPVVITSELNRSPEYREGIDGKCPQLCDLRSCGAIEGIADKVLLLHRPEYYHILMDERGNDLRGIIIVIVAKNKYGSTGDVRLRFEPTKCRVVDFGGSVRDKEEQELSFLSHLHEQDTFQMLSDKLGLELDNDSKSYPF